MMRGWLNNVHRHSYFPVVLLLYFAKLNGLVLLLIGPRGGKQQGLDFDLMSPGPSASTCQTLAFGIQGEITIVTLLVPCLFKRFILSHLVAPHFDLCFLDFRTFLIDLYCDHKSNILTKTKSQSLNM